jgi:hypothetical protein
MVYHLALSLATPEQKKILNKPPIQESDRLRFAGYQATLAVVCDELAILVFKHVVTNNPIVQEEPKNKRRTPTEYKNLLVSYTYTRLEQMKKQNKN